MAPTPIDRPFGAAQLDNECLALQSDRGVAIERRVDVGRVVAVFLLIAPSHHGAPLIARAPWLGVFAELATAGASPLTDRAMRANSS